MGVSSTTNTVVYSGDGMSLSFSFPYYFFFQADMFVYIYDTVALTIAQKVLGTDYTISGTPNAQGLYPSGANMVFGVAPSATEKVVISRFPVDIQNYALLQNGLISSTAIVQQFDYLTLLVQSLQDQLNRCLKLPAGFAPTFDPDLPADVPADYFVAINPTADGMVLSASSAGPTGPQGPAGPTGPAGPSGGALTVAPASANTTLAVSSPVGGQYIPCDATGGAFNVTLPLANLAAVGQLFQIKQVDNSGNVVTILANGADNILSTGLVASLALNYQGKSYTLVCRAVGLWDVI